MYLPMLWGRSALASSPPRSKGMALRAPRCEEVFEKTRGGYGYCVPKELNLKQEESVSCERCGQGLLGLADGFIPNIEG